MSSEVLLLRIAKAIQANGKYSQLQDSWTIGVPNLQVIIDGLLDQESHENRPTLLEILEEGKLQRFWVVNYDHEFLADLVVIRLLFGRK